jgi:hypothetical protein
VTDRPSFACPCCGAISYNPNDIAQRFCGRCHDWTGDPGLAARHFARDCPHRTEGRTTAEIPDAAVRAAIAEHARLLSDRPDPMVLSDVTLFRRVLEAALPHLRTATPPAAAGPYRCPTPCDDDCEINGWGCHEAHAMPKQREHDPEACEARTLVANLRWLFAGGWMVELGRADTEREDVTFWANVRRTGDLWSVHWSGASVAEAAGKARAAREIVVREVES